MSNKIEALLKQVSESTTEVIGIIHEIDGKIERLNAQRQAIGDASVSQAEFLGYIASNIDSRTDRFSAMMMGELKRMSPAFFSLDNMLMRPQLLTHDASLPVVITEEACLWYLKPAIMARMEELTNSMDFPDPEVAIPVATRREMIASIDEEIGTLRAERNELARQLQELGVVS